MGVRRSKVKYVPDHKGVAALALDAPMSRGMTTIAREAIGVAQANSPVKTGDYVSSFSAVPMPERAGWKNELRAGAALVNDSDHAMAVEYRNNSHVLGRTLAIIDSSRRGRKPSAARRAKPSGAS